MVKLKKQSIDKIWNGTLLLLPDANVRKTNARGIELTDEQPGKKTAVLKKDGTRLSTPTGFARYG